jgi:hypothetical protein
MSAVLKGKDTYENLQEYLQLNEADGIVRIYESIIGEIPVVSVDDSRDFTTIVQSFLHKIILLRSLNRWELSL